ncbi:hypothetical protein B0T21DRAFT_377154 [Apiosordaria backusii]|uniref:C2H2-type domain-containing protein n=1 Tax=Apiosordaria backusii TaxID=314023 RepID=A0AA40A417_9PEZI|nr:hypothetical protein B0T21DRAFT_377154 [Apiosordaria backusii]
MDHNIETSLCDPAQPPIPPTGDVFVGVCDGEIPTRSETENRLVMGQTYFVDDHPDFEKADFSLMRGKGLWQDGPIMVRIDTSYRVQPETSQHAIRKYEQMCKDADASSCGSQAATWGTQQPSLPDLAYEAEQADETKGAFLRRLLNEPTLSLPHSPHAKLELTKKRPYEEPLKNSEPSSQDTVPYPTPISSHDRFSQSQSIPPSLLQNPRPQMSVSGLEDKVYIKNEETDDDFSMYNDSELSQSDGPIFGINLSSKKERGLSLVVSKGGPHNCHTNYDEEHTPMVDRSTLTVPILPPAPLMPVENSKTDMLPPNRPEETGQPNKENLDTELPRNLASVEVPATDLMSLTNTESPDQFKSASSRIKPTPATPPKTWVRQTGVARIRLQLLSISKINSQYDTSPSASDCGESHLDDQEDPLDDDGARASEEQSSSSVGSGGAQQACPSAALGSLAGNGEDGQSRKRKTDDDEEGGGSRKRLRQKTPGAIGGQQVFACPYHVHEPNPWQNPCFSKNKGFKGMTRIKQHLSRKHMVSRRCPRCWISFESKEKENQHRQPLQCMEKPKPTEGRFMAAHHEGMVSTLALSAANPEQTWWQLFQILIPGMQEQSLDILKKCYPLAPYHAAPTLHGSTIIPPIRIDNLLFSTPNGSNPSGSDVGLQSPNVAELSSGAPGTSNVLLPSQSPHQPQVVSQAFPVPIFDVEPQFGQLPYPPPERTGLTPEPPGMHLFNHWLDPNPVLQPAPVNLSVSMTTSDSLSQFMSSNAVADSSRATSSFYAGANASDNDQQQSRDFQQLQRSNVRLRDRLQRAGRANERVERELTDLVNMNQAARTDLGRADSLLEELMDLPCLPDNMYEGLKKLSKLLETVTDNLKRGA